MLIHFLGESSSPTASRVSKSRNRGCVTSFGVDQLLPSAAQARCAIGGTNVMTCLGARSSACRCRALLEPYSAISGIRVAMIVFTVADIRRNPLRKRFARGP
jgi:hypothetical protein